MLNTTYLNLLLTIDKILLINGISPININELTLLDCNVLIKQYIDYLKEQQNAINETHASEKFSLPKLDNNLNLSNTNNLPKFNFPDQNFIKNLPKL